MTRMGQKLPAQQTPTRFTSVMSDATVRANQRKVLGDVPEFMGLSSRATGTLAAESLALKTSNKKFFSTLKTGLKRSRARTATGIKTIRKTKPVSKPAAKPAAPVDPELQKYEKLRKSDPVKAKELGTKIWLKKYGAPTEGDIA